MNKLVVLTFNHEGEDNFILNKMNETSRVDVYPVLRDVGIIGKCLRRINFKLFPFYVDYWFSKKWINSIEKNDTVVCMAHYWSPAILKRISKKYNCNCINYFWDKVVVSGYPIERGKVFENWTFDLEDSRTYKMRYNPQFYVENLVEKNQIVEYDVCYVGADRNGTLVDRVAMANEYYSKMRELNLKLFFYLLTKSAKANAEIAANVPMNVKDVLDIMMKSKAVLEIIDSDKVEWLTLRPFQALTNNRKLITNNRKIVYYDFYNSNNIFVIGKDNWGDLPEFLNTPFEKMECLEKYSIENWKMRFLENKEV